jgi:hypothetical protein
MIASTHGSSSTYVAIVLFLAQFSSLQRLNVLNATGGRNGKAHHVFHMVVKW